MKLVFLIVILLGVGVSLPSQETSTYVLSGSVTNQKGQPLSSAKVTLTLPGFDGHAVTTDSGIFKIAIPQKFVGRKGVLTIILKGWRVENTDDLNEELLIDRLEHEVKKIIMIKDTLSDTPPPPFKNIDILLGPFVQILPGSFLMGNDNDKHKTNVAIPAHEVEFTYGFEMGQCEVTQMQWAQIMLLPETLENKDPEFPIANISWTDAQNFIEKVNEKSKQYKYRLPLEAEWEYACRAGDATNDYPKAKLEEIAWYGQPGEGSCMKVKIGRMPNKWGLYDMIGNVKELCLDWYAPYKPEKQVYQNPQPDPDLNKPEDARVKVYRGGSYGSSIDYCNPYHRSTFTLVESSKFTGFRLVRTKKSLPKELKK